MFGFILTNTVRSYTIIHLILLMTYLIKYVFQIKTKRFADE